LLSVYAFVVIHNYATIERVEVFNFTRTTYTLYQHSFVLLHQHYHLCQVGLGSRRKLALVDQLFQNVGLIALVISS